MNMATTEIPPGWHEDPSRPGLRRWWDGTAWTEHFREFADEASFDSSPPKQVPSAESLATAPPKYGGPGSGATGGARSSHQDGPQKANVFERYLGALKEHVWVRWVSGVVALIIVVSIASGDSTESSTQKSTNTPSSQSSTESSATAQAADGSEEGAEAEKTPPPKKLSEKEEIAAAFNEEMSGDPIGDRKRVRYVEKYGKREYLVGITTNELVFGEDEVLRDLRPVFGRLFNEENMREIGVNAFTTLQTAGGKETFGRIFFIRCDRAANDEIDWEVVDEDGMKQLCTYQLLVSK